MVRSSKSKMQTSKMVKSSCRKMVIKNNKSKSLSMNKRMIKLRKPIKMKMKSKL